MKVLVSFKRVPDPDTKITILPNGMEISMQGVKFVINPLDEITLEESIRIKERGDATEVTCVTVGGEACIEQIRSALAMGADCALYVKEDCILDPSAIARILRAIVERETPDIVFIYRSSGK